MLTNIKNCRKKTKQKAFIYFFLGIVTQIRIDHETDLSKSIKPHSPEIIRKL